MTETTNPIDGTVVSFEVAGAGPAIVLVHGSGLSRVIWRGFGYVRALREEFRVISMDLRGHGRSGKPHRQTDYRMSMVVADIVAALDAAGEQSAHYFGYSFGARAGFSFAEHHPDRLFSLVSAGGTHRAPGSSVAELFFPDYGSALAEGGMQLFLTRWEQASGRPMDPQTAAAFLRNDPCALLAYFQQVETEPGIADATLAAITTPTLLLAGTLDGPRYRDSELAARLLPNAVFQALVGRDHASTLRPAGEVLASVLPFLRRPGVSPNDPAPNGAVPTVERSA